MLKCRDKLKGMKLNSELRIDIQEFVDTIDVTKNPDFANYLKEALIWLGKRQGYSHIYFQQLKRATSQRKLEASLFMDDHLVRARYEAANLAYLQNIHAACDAFPFALHILLGGLSTAKIKSENEHFKWNAKLIGEVVKKFPNAVQLHDALQDFAGDTNFLMLASLVNQAKHKFFPRLFCNLDVQRNQYFLTVSFDYLTYTEGKATSNNKTHLDILDFAKKLHNETLYKIFVLYKLAYTSAST